MFDSSSGQFVCPSQSREGITLTMRFTLYDKDGNVLSVLDREKVASIRTETSASGTTSREGASVTIDRSGVMVTTGLGPQATTHTLNGTERGTVTASATINGVATTTTTSMLESTNNLVVPARRSSGDPGYPLSGERVRTATTTTTHGSTSRTLTTERRETFNGTSVVQVQITVNGVTQHCTYDLAARTSTCR
ncbi:MAG TPA: hypothetical protein VM364_11385 [Vicinamibacterales bacterium]|nr:hypothetical protein [Vicinamibacterales bacterium]